ncbi:hypothetical protein [Arthrobacter koreensis]|uniref:hypothetical protein n=1 Tax=Arthrobacter koreensis TaxID=199136 RepID=UPI00381C1E99
MAAPITVARNASVDFPAVTISGEVIYLSDQKALLLLDKETGAPERLSINLEGYGLLPRPGNVFIKDWSEGSGVTESLVDSGLVEIVQTHTVGPFDTTAYEVKVRV